MKLSETLLTNNIAEIDIKLCIKKNIYIENKSTNKPTNQPTNKISWQEDRQTVTEIETKQRRANEGQSRQKWWVQQAEVKRMVISL